MVSCGRILAASTTLGTWLFATHSPYEMDETLEPHLLDGGGDIAFNPDSNFLVSGSLDSVYVWDIASHTPRLTRELEGSKFYFAFSGDSRGLVRELTQEGRQRKTRATQPAINELADVTGGHFGSDPGVLPPTRMSVELFETQDSIQTGKNGFNDLAPPAEPGALVGRPGGRFVGLGRGKDGGVIMSFPMG